MDKQLLGTETENMTYEVYNHINENRMDTIQIVLCDAIYVYDEFNLLTLCFTFPPGVAPTIDCAAASCAASVDEGVSAGTTVGTFSATDDGTVVSWALSGMVRYTTIFVFFFCPDYIKEIAYIHVNTTEHTQDENTIHLFHSRNAIYINTQTKLHMTI
jgi:hypothetical protein